MPEKNKPFEKNQRPSAYIEIIKTHAKNKISLMF